MVEGRFFEPETKPINQLIRESYDYYLEHFDYDEGELMSYEDFADWWMRY